MKRIYDKSSRNELRLLYSKSRIAAAVKELAARINIDYAGQEIILIVVLKGAFIFAADLSRSIKVPVSIEFVTLTSYSGMATTGKVTITRDVEGDVKGKNVLVVEDIVDTGISLAFLLEKLKKKGPRSVKACSLIDKRERRRVDVSVDYAGIVCDSGFLVGYGLDLDGKSRELSAIYEVVQIPLVEV